jgi:hypothetical protein
VARAALAVDGIQSAAIFVRRSGSADLDLAASAGIEGPPLDGLVAAVRNPAHPIVRALTDPGPTFDVRPMSPGGPALRAHLPLDGRGVRRVRGVLAVAYELPLSPGDRSALERLATEASDLLSPNAT